jgi:phage tail protein X
LGENETNDYIRHRLAVADFKGSDLFDRRAQQLIWEYSHGIPRKINILCDNALLTGYGVKKKRITASLMEEAIKDLTWSPFAPASASPDQIAAQATEKHRRVDTRPRPHRLALAAGLAFMAVIIFGVGLILGHSGLDWRGKISRLSQHVFQSQKNSQGAGRSPVTTLPGADAQSSMTQEVKAGGPPAEKVETDPVPAENDEAVSVPAQKAETEPVPAVEVTTANAPEEEVKAAHVLAEEVEAARVSVEGAVTPGIAAETIGSASTATARQANSLAESIGAIEETKKEAAPSAQKETTTESDAAQALELPQQRLPLELSIRPGDTLASIIKQHYGSYNKETLSAVLHENPEIQNPDQILVGEILKLPLLSEKP